MVSNNEAANALLKLKTSKKPKAKAKPVPKPKPRPSTLSAKELNNKYRVETTIVGSRSNKPKNNNNKKKAASNFLQMLFTPRKNTNKK